MIKSDIVGQLRNIKGEYTADQSWNSLSTRERLHECLLGDHVETVVGGVTDAVITLAGCVLDFAVLLPFHGWNHVKHSLGDIMMLEM